MVLSLISFPFLPNILISLFLKVTSRQVNSSLNSSASSFMMKLKSWFDALWEISGVPLGVLHFKLHMLFAAPLYEPL